MPDRHNTPKAPVKTYGNHYVLSETKMCAKKERNSYICPICGDRVK